MSDREPRPASGGPRAEQRLRRRHRRRWVRRLVHAVPPAGPRPVRAGLRGGRRRRRHVVLEPLPRRPLRRREHGLLVLLLRRAPAGVALDRAVRLPARDPGYIEHVADRFDLRRDIQLDTRVTAGAFDEAANRWHDRDGSRRPRGGAFCIMATGLPVERQIPPSRVWRASRALAYHTGHWPHAGVDFTGQRVGVIGTGSSAIQSIPIIARQAASLVVFQRTPNFSMPAWNGPLDPEYERG